MDEQQIADQLKQNIPKPTEHTLAAPVVSDPQQVPIEYELDEFTQYKLHQHFGETYKEGDQRARQQMSYIYQSVSEQLGTKEYIEVASKINELKRMLGLNHAPDARYKLYQWLKLDQKRSKYEQAQRMIANA